MKRLLASPIPCGTTSQLRTSHAGLLGVLTAALLAAPNSVAAQPAGIESCLGRYAGQFEGGLVADGAGGLNRFPDGRILFSVGWNNATQGREAGVSGGNTFEIADDGALRVLTPATSFTIGGSFSVADCSASGGYFFTNPPLSGTWTLQLEGFDGGTGNGGGTNDGTNDPPPDDCDSVLRWIGSDGDALSNPDSWDLLDAPVDTDRLVFSGSGMNGGVVQLAGDAAHDSLDVIADFVALDLNGQALTFTGNCIPQSLSVQSDGAADAGALFVTSTGSEGILETRNISVGDAPFDQGTLSIDDDVFADVSDDCTIGFEGDGRLEVASALVRIGGDLVVADKAESNGTVNVARGSDLAINLAHPVNLEVRGETRVGVAGVGTLTIQDGSVDSTDGLTIIGVESSGIGTAIVDGGSLWQTGSVEIGRRGDGDLIIRNDSQVFSTSAVIGTNGAGGATLASGGRWELSSDLFVGITSPGNLVLDELSEVITDTLHVGPSGRVEGFVIEINPADDATNQKRQTLAQQAPGQPGVIRTARLVVEGDAQLDVDSISLALGGTLAGDGTFAFDVDNPGVVAPGVDECTTGTLTVAGDYLQRPEGTLAIKIGGTRAGSQFGRLAVTGQATLAGTVRVDAIDGFRPRPGQAFAILTAAGVTGQFDGIEGDGSYELSYDAGEVVLTVLESPNLVAPPCDQGGGNGLRICGAGVAPAIIFLMFGLRLMRPRRALRVFRVRPADTRTGTGSWCGHRHRPGLPPGVEREVS